MTRDIVPPRFVLLNGETITLRARAAGDSPFGNAPSVHVFASCDGVEIATGDNLTDSDEWDRLVLEIGKRYAESNPFADHPLGKMNFIEPRTITIAGHEVSMVTKGPGVSMSAPEPYAPIRPFFAVASSEGVSRLVPGSEFHGLPEWRRIIRLVREWVENENPWGWTDRR